ncbi:MAG: hypothetical protein R3261_09490, partial [Alphaproteobacteria bacterium]|nr:hypothetical protein [Alphaproteobacteria bacterium]
MSEQNQGNLPYQEFLSRLFPSLEQNTDSLAWQKNNEILLKKISQAQDAFLTQLKHNIDNKDTSLDPSAMDPFGLGKSFLELTQKLMDDPEKLVNQQNAYWQNMWTLWQQTAQRMMPNQNVDDTEQSASSKPVAEPAAGDRRFKDEAWDEHAIFDFLKQSYLLSANYLQSTIDAAEDLDPNTAKKLHFFTQQFNDAVSPSNFWMTNPVVLKETLESNGDNLVKGFDNLLSDFDSETGKLKISMTDYNAFEVGKNLATTEGKVIFQNELMQLIQYSPLTEEVYKKPLLIIPPWINKFYILDLGEKKSFIRYAVEQGFTVFIISWVNPDESLRDYNFADYMLKGPLTALDVIEQATGEKNVNAIGYCIGGTLLSATLAYLGKKNDKRITHATFFTTLTDFSDAGELKIFTEEEQISHIEKVMAKQGYLDGSEMALTFNMLRPNDLIWSFVVNNYLLGKQPFPFDLLYWNSDSTRMPEKMHSYYLRNMYLENN